VVSTCPEKSVGFTFACPRLAEGCVGDGQGFVYGRPGFATGNESRNRVALCLLTRTNLKAFDIQFVPNCSPSSSVETIFRFAGVHFRKKKTEIENVDSKMLN